MRVCNTLTSLQKIDVILVHLYVYIGNNQLRIHNVLTDNF